MKNKLTLFIFLLVSGITSAGAQSPLNEITLDVFEQKLKASKDAQILDVRSAQEYEENHLPGAINFSVHDSLFHLRVRSLKRDHPVFVYSINNGRSSVVASKLRDLGFEVYQLPGGIARWLGAGKPVVTSKPVGIGVEEFNRTISGNQLTLVSVGSKYCGGCAKVAPIITDIEERDKELKIVRVELYENRDLARYLDIESVPTIILYKSGRQIWTKSGSITKVDIQDALDNSL